MSDTKFHELKPELESLIFHLRDVGKGEDADRVALLVEKFEAVERCGVLRKREIEEMLAVDDSLEFISYNQLQAALKGERP